MNNAYPRPQLQRDSFFSLDGAWELNGQPVRVPYPPQAALSGWQGEVPEELHYVRRFSLPGDFTAAGKRTILHIGAVDQTAQVFLNGQLVCTHEGGYLPFEADITALLRPGVNELRVDAEDRLLRIYPYGKQCRKPRGMWYTPVSGIWQSVWLEQVPERYITRLDISPDYESVTLTVHTNDGQGQAEVLIEGMPPVSLQAGRPVRIAIPRPELWTPDSPRLYGLRVCLGQDQVRSYFALRTVSVVSDRTGRPAIALNGRPVFLNALLDQGYFPDGLFQPEDPEEYARDVERAKRLGFNTLRKHIKVEPESFYAACDRLGMLVIQDMVNAGPYHYIRDTVLPNAGLKCRPDFVPGGRRRKAFFEQHCRDIQDHLRNHPCVVAYTIFNEGWGQYDTSRIYRMLRARDTSRLYISSSGWFKGYETDIDSEHIYFRNRVISRKNRPLLLSECGGYTYDASASTRETYGYGKTESPGELTARIETLYREMVFPSIEKGLNGVAYTQLTDVEGEINGLYPYDRKTCKVIEDRIRALTDRAARRFKELYDLEDRP